ncbi:cysteine hydrolase [Synechococcus sp. CC9311]|uniref:cysteine hydrolase n=1 Tax=Synechococcus sp. (strain CC9311) TaxID=64471 RepID=UPI0000DDAD29|nr:cysteine hydrolase [Synechococcus sp. CC9311]ABI47339.1 isochorismatase family protein [Synechococcus sp. CC9311]|mmetsp:Transcript_40643/g.94983  ORF Transcript_40643/g.94983 Transcript_40643/m.94983 type:complete len:207 (-) Transcript_40643:175-795(-)
MSPVSPRNTALLLIGFQRDYFDPDGILYSVVEESHRISGTLEHTIQVIDSILDTSITIVNTPIVFSESYHEIENPMGILKAIKDAEAFKVGTTGAETLPQIEKYGDRIVIIPGKRGFNAFSNTELKDLLVKKGIERLVIAGCVTSLCVNATALAAKENGFEVTILSDCTSSRTPVEQDMFCKEIFPLFTDVVDHNEFAKAIVRDSD